MNDDYFNRQLAAPAAANVGNDDVVPKEYIAAIATQYWWKLLHDKFNDWMIMLEDKVTPDELRYIKQCIARHTYVLGSFWEAECGPLEDYLTQDAYRDLCRWLGRNRTRPYGELALKTGRSERQIRNAFYRPEKCSPLLIKELLAQYVADTRGFH